MDCLREMRGLAALCFSQSVFAKIFSLLERLRGEKPCSGFVSSRPQGNEQGPASLIPKFTVDALSQRLPDTHSLVVASGCDA